MRIKTKQEIEYWLTRSRNGKLIRVYRVDSNENEPFDKHENPFDVPIMVEYTGMAEGIADILDSRDKLREEKEYFEKQLLKERQEESDRRYRESKTKKKWYQFFK